MLRNMLTLITPIRITRNDHLDNFRRTIESYYRIFGHDKPRHITSSSNPEGYAGTFFKLMKSYNSDGWKDVAQGSKPVDALREMVRAVETPYVHVTLADVCALGEKNFLDIGIRAMETDKSICQMRYGDDPLGCSRPTNLSSFASDGTHVFFKGMPEYPFEPMQITSYSSTDLPPIKLGKEEATVSFPERDMVWRYPMAAAAQKKWIGFAFWPCTYRTEVLKRVVEECEKRKDTQQPQWKNTLAGWMSIMNRTADFAGWCLPEKGWPEGFEFLEDLKQGTLNMACYMAALDREQKVKWGMGRKPDDWTEFNETARIELKETPPAGEIG